MQKNNLLNLAEGVTSWAELESRIAGLSTEGNRGAAFEEFCKAFFLLDPVFQFIKVYRHTEIPPSLRSRLGYPGHQDIGIDGLAVTDEGKLFAYQAKFRSDRHKTPTLRELSTFFTVSDRADWRITITNANSLPASINDRTRNSRVLADRLEQLDADFFDRLRLYLKEQPVPPPTIIAPHQTQQEAINAALSHFKDHNRGQLILPCGTGKTLASMWIAEKLGGRRILVMLPSLALLSQTLRAWAANTSIRPFRYLCLCSDTTVDLGNDSPIEHLYEMDVPVTTDVETVAGFLEDKRDRTSILFSTYQSSKVLSKATKKTATVFDMGIFDEAHRTTGAKVGVWNLALDDKHVPIKSRLFMTATPLYAPHIMKKAEENDVLVCSMDDHRFYGEPFYEMTFGDAIERGHISDYKIVVICVTDSEVRKIIQQGGMVITDDERAWDAKALAKRIALVKGLKGYLLKKVFTFHGRVNGAKAFTDTKTPYGINKVFKMLYPESYSQQVIKFFHVNGTMPSGLRCSLMNEFKQSEIGIMSNARCLTEGVDVPIVDTVAFIDPKRSLIDIVQATGRAMRKAEWKVTGYIFIPVVVEETDNPETFIENSDFKAVWQVLQAMVEQDQRLEDTVSNLRVMQGKGEEDTQAWKEAMFEYSEKISFYDLPRKIDKTRFINTLFAKTLEVVGKRWDFWYGLTLHYKEQYGDPNAPTYYKTPEGYKLGSWQVYQRSYYKNGKLNAVRIKMLQDIGFIWSPYGEAFEKGFQETLNYKKLKGDPNTPTDYITFEGYKLGNWQNKQRSNKRKNKLDRDKTKRLEDIGFKWEIKAETFEKGFQETLKYKKQFGYANASHLYITHEGYKLGLWQFNIINRKENLNSADMKRLEDIGFKWKIKAETFEKGFLETLKYKKQFGYANTPIDYITPEGYNLSSWQTYIKSKFKKGILASEKVKMLGEIGFKWNPQKIEYDKLFEKGLQETLRYKKKYGDSNSPTDYITVEGYKLGTWQVSKRSLYQSGTLTPDKIKRLEAIGFKWRINKEKFDTAFQRGFKETLKYKEQFSDPNASRGYETPDGYKLGSWQSNIRYRKNKLTPDRIKKLEEIGFKWVIKKEE
jgi:superfamily II DNA or RNA helicase